MAPKPVSGLLPRPTLSLVDDASPREGASKEATFGAHLGGPLSVNGVNTMAPLMLCDQVGLWYGDKDVPTGAAPATVMYGSMVRQPGLGLLDSRPVTKLASLGPKRVFRQLVARSFGGWTSRRLMAT